MFRYAQFSCSTHCVKSVQIRSFFWSIFSCMWLCKPNTHTILHKRHGNCAKSYFPPSSLNKTENMNYFEHNNKLGLYEKLQTALKWIRWFSFPKDITYSSNSSVFKQQLTYVLLLFKIGVLKNYAVFTGKHMCWSLFLIKFQAFTFTTPTQVFSSEYCENFKNSFFTEHLRWLLHVFLHSFNFF